MQCCLSLYPLTHLDVPFIPSRLVQPVKTEESQTMAAIVSGSTRSLDGASPPSDRASSLQPHSSEEEPQASGVDHVGVQHKDEADLSVARVNTCLRPRWVSEETWRSSACRGDLKLLF